MGHVQYRIYKNTAFKIKSNYKVYNIIKKG